MVWMLGAALLWIGYLVYLGVTREETLQVHLLGLWIALAASAVVLPLLGF